ncbi:phytoene desaturase family protein [Falsiroseomonas sp. CW058]|uniref:phytoene desaturase family protein n=1 Tax=Falsiroseomonas sp. CW058 TaxID=3388664 RepID=UPI003D3140A3
MVIGAGMGGLAAALLLAAQGRGVVVLERAPRPGGKIRRVEAGGAEVEAGPALLTLRDVFEAIFDAAGASLDAHVALRPEAMLGRHVFADGTRLDLPADQGAAAEAIGGFAGAAAARGFLDFCARAARIHAALDAPFLRSQRPGAARFAAAAGLRGMLGAAPFGTLWDALGGHFADTRLRQVFARAAAYVGTSPLQAPATLMLVSHVERMGTWRVEGGMGRLVAALEALARAKGAAFRYGAEVREVVARSGRAAGVRLADGEVVAARAVIANADVASLGAGRLGAAAARAVGEVPVARRSFSAVTWAMRAAVAGGPPAAQTVFHPADPAAEYADLGYRGRLPAAPGVTLWAQDRREGDAPPPGAAERLLAMVSAPARADLRPLPPTALAACEAAAFGLMRRGGVEILRDPAAEVVTTPDDFEHLFPGTGGALYGPAVQGWQAAFSRPAAWTKLPGLYLAGGGTHPGAGVAMAALSGRLAAQRVIGDGG